MADGANTAVLECLRDQGWKLIVVLTGRASPTLLHSYSAERLAAAKALMETRKRGDPGHHGLVAELVDEQKSGPCCHGPDLVVGFTPAVP
jgi:hypothetical protein